MAPRSSITKRWLLNSFGIIVVIMVAMVIVVPAWKAPRPMRAATLMPGCMSWYRILSTGTA